MKYFCVVETAQGFTALAGQDGKLTASTLPKSTREDAIDALEIPYAGFMDSAVENEAALTDIADGLRRYFSGEVVDFSDVELDLNGYGEFHLAVLRAAQQIPYGKLVTYGDLAGMAGSKRAARAAGSAMAKNRLPIIIPCHRVIAAGGKPGGFSSGLDWKRRMLAIEGVEL